MISRSEAQIDFVAVNETDRVATLATIKPNWVRLRRARPVLQGLIDPVLWTHRPFRDWRIARAIAAVIDAPPCAVFLEQRLVRQNANDLEVGL